jgi:hypothetical protein
MIMENKDSMNKSQPGTGSAENKGQDRKEQVNRSKDMSQADKQDIANQIGEDPGHIASQRDMGILSGRDDSSGGSGDRMEGTNTGERTDR